MQIMNISEYNTYCEYSVQDLHLHIISSMNIHNILMENHESCVIDYI